MTDEKMPLTAHLEELRKRLIVSLIALAVGFGISRREDVDFLTGKADIAVIGTKTINLVEEQGVEAVGPFIAGLR